MLSPGDWVIADLDGYHAIRIPNDRFRNEFDPIVEPILLDPETCTHDQHFVNVEIDKIVDKGTWYACIHITCLDCKTGFAFVGLPMGLSPSRLA